MRKLCRIKFFFLFLLAAALFNSAYADTQCTNGDCPVNVSITVVSVESYNETIEAIESPVPIPVPIGEINITVPANVSYIHSLMFTVDIREYIKGVIGINGNVSFNLTTGPGVAGTNFTGNPDDVVLDIFLEITGGIVDPDLGYVDIYFALPKTIIDGISSDAVDNMKTFVTHDNGTNVIYELVNQPSLDLATHYMFKVRITEFSIFRIFYREPSEEAITPEIIPPVIPAKKGCFSRWECGGWSSCVNEKQTRTCKDTGTCRLSSRTEEKDCKMLSVVSEEIPRVPGEREEEITEEKPSIITLTTDIIFTVLLIIIAIGVFAYQYVRGFTKKQKIINLKRMGQELNWLKKKIRKK